MSPLARTIEGPPAGGLFLGLCLGLFGGCASDAEDPTPPPEETEAVTLPEGAEAVSLLGDTLYAGELPADVLAERTVQLEEARAEYEASPDDADAIIWLGRRTAYLSRYREAIEIYTEGIVKHPEDPRMYRHRGHRFISTRQLDRAVEDFQRATELIADEDDEIEPDGQPNARNIPTSTLHSNIWYHLGLARYLQGDFEGALAAYRRCMDVSRNPDMLVATSHWLYMTLRRLGADAEAAEVLEPIHADLDVIENQSYHQLLLMYKGGLDPNSLWGSEGDALGNATVGYGIGHWHLYNGRPWEAESVFRRVLGTGQWAAFGYLAAEAELSRLGG
jgi:tetratricopeptide (TPR) repeat protein